MSEEFIKSLVEKRNKMLTRPANVQIEEIDFPDSDKDSSSEEDIKPVPLERAYAPMTKKQPARFDITPLETEILDMCKMYKNETTAILLMYNFKPRLTSVDIADIKKNIKVLNELFEDNLGCISQDLPQGVNFSDAVYDTIDATADNVDATVERFIYS
jgi:hypothetical protein